MASFKELWTLSQTFRQLFLHTKVFKASSVYDVARAEAMWWERWPHIEWGFCPAEGCTTLVMVGEKCADHGTCLPTWRWQSGILYRCMKTHVDERGKIVSGWRDTWQYRAYAKYRAVKAHGHVLLEDGYVTACLDGNPFNLRNNNIIIVSKIARLAIDAKIIKPSQAMEMDDALLSFWFRAGGRGRPRSQWVYGYEQIANVAGVTVHRVRQAVSREQLNPKDLASVMEFCNNTKGLGDSTMSAG